MANNTMRTGHRLSGQVVIVITVVRIGHTLHMLVITGQVESAQVRTRLIDYFIYCVREIRTRYRVTVHVR